MRTVFAPFRNEEYLLPFWLRHHRDIFDHGVLIDHHSTDRSCEIIRELVPNWEVVPTEQEDFDVVDTDFEIMLHERRFEGWKICLNVTEFLCAESLGAVEARVEAADLLGAHGRGVIMAEPVASGLPPPDPQKSLVAQRTFGYFEDEVSWGGMLRRWGFDVKPVYRPKRPTLLVTRPNLLTRRDPIMFRSRLYHKARQGSYQVGRHASFWSRLCAAPQNDFLVLHYYYSPRTPQMHLRASRQGARFSAVAIKQDSGSHHLRYLRDAALWEKDAEARAHKSRELSTNEVFARNTAPWRLS